MEEGRVKTAEKSEFRKSNSLPYFRPHCQFKNSAPGTSIYSPLLLPHPRPLRPLPPPPPHNAPRHLNLPPRAPPPRRPALERTPLDPRPHLNPSLRRRLLLPRNGQHKGPLHGERPGRGRRRATHRRPGARSRAGGGGGGGVWVCWC